MKQRVNAQPFLLYQKLMGCRLIFRAPSVRPLNKATRRKSTIETARSSACGGRTLTLSSPWIAESVPDRWCAGPYRHEQNARKCLRCLQGSWYEMRRVIGRRTRKLDRNFWEVVEPDGIRPELEPERLFLLSLDFFGLRCSSIHIFKPFSKIDGRIRGKNMNAGIVADDDGVGDDISNGDLALADTGFS